MICSSGQMDGITSCGMLEKVYCIRYQSGFFPLYIVGIGLPCLRSFSCGT